MDIGDGEKLKELLRKTDSLEDLFLRDVEFSIGYLDVQHIKFKKKKRI